MHSLSIGKEVGGVEGGVVVTVNTNVEQSGLVDTVDVKTRAAKESYD